MFIYQQDHCVQCLWKNYIMQSSYTLTILYPIG